MDLVGIEPTTSSMPWKRAPICATGPLVKRGTRQLLRRVYRIFAYLVTIVKPPRISIYYATHGLISQFDSGSIFIGWVDCVP